MNSATHPIIVQLITLCPGAAPAWAEHLAFWEGEPDRGVFNDFDVFAHHVVSAAKVNDFGPADTVFAYLENTFPGASEETRGLLTWGLLESIQVISSHAPGLEAKLAARLQPTTRDAWHAIEDAWRGRGSLAEVLRAEARAGRRGQHS